MLKHHDRYIKRFVLIRTALLMICAGVLSSGSLKAQDENPGQIMPLFQTGEIMDLSIEADFKAIFSVGEDSAYFPGFFTIRDNDGLERTIEIKLRARGKTRRQNKICRFAPLRLNFPKSEMKNTPFEGQNVIKLVTHCDKADSFEQNTILEYLIYKIFNVLTDSSFKVRPAMINYVYSDQKADTIRKFAFFIEREKHLAERLQAIEIKDEKVHPDQLDPFQTCLVDVFDYMIGNTDYSIYEQHNIVLYTDTSRKLPPVPIPYDFDWSGLVSASYAEPHPLTGTEHVTDRIYRGLKKDRAIVNKTILLFNEKKQEIYKIIEEFELLEKNEKKQALKYLDDFYWIINNERQVNTEFFEKARTVESEE